MPGNSLRILHVVPRWECGGTRSHVRTLRRALEARGHRTVLAAWFPQGERTDTDAVPLPLYAGTGGRKSTFGALGAMRALRRTIFAESIDVVHAHGRYAAALASLASRGTAAVQVYTAHALFDDRRRFRWYPRHIVCPSETARSFFLGRTSDAERFAIHVIPHGIEVDAEAGESDRDRSTFLFAGRLASEKGGDVLIDAAYELGRRTVHPFAVHFAGTGPERTAWERRARRLLPAERFRFLGARDDVAALMRAALAVVAPTRGREAFGLVIAEALVAGAPVIASDLPAYREVAREDPSVRFVTPEDRAALAEAMRTILDARGGPRPAPAAALRARFDAATMAERYERVYRAALVDF